MCCCSRAARALLLGVTCLLGACRLSVDGPPAAPAPSPNEPAAPAPSPNEPAAPAPSPNEPATPTARLRTAQFAIAIPPGYRVPPLKMREAMLQAEGASQVRTILIKARAQPDHFVTSIVVVEVDGSDFDPTSAELCQEMAAASAASVGAEADEVRIIALPIGRTCQFVMRGEAHRRAIQTVVYLGDQQWSVTCNHDERDGASPGECASVLQSFSAPG